MNGKKLKKNQEVILIKKQFILGSVENMKKYKHTKMALFIILMTTVIAFLVEHTILLICWYLNGEFREINYCGYLLAVVTVF